MNQYLKTMGLGLAGKLIDLGVAKLTSPHRTSPEERIEQINKTLETLESAPGEGQHPARPLTEAPQSQKEEASEGKLTPTTIQEPEKSPKPVAVEEAKGTACDICSLDHISTCAGILEEANRFARREGVDDPEVIRRISICRQQLNALERDDANPQKLVELPRIEREIMERILPKAGKLRHRLNEIVSLETLEQVTAETQDLSDQFQNDIFHLQLKRKLPKAEIKNSNPDMPPEEEVGRLSPEDKERILKRAEELIEGV